MKQKTRILAPALALLTTTALLAAQAERSPVPAAADAVLAGVHEPGIAELIRETLERNPEVAGGRARARAARALAPQVRSLPDPTAHLTAFVQEPETRVGAQRFSVTLAQRFPGWGKLALRERAALLGAAALEADVEASRLALVTEVRTLRHELAFLDRYRDVNRTFRGHLVQHEEISRARYATGVGQGQAVVKLQAEITRVDSELLAIEARRAKLLARLNSLRDRPVGLELPSRIPPPRTLASARHADFDLERLTYRAHLARPEIAAADLRVVRAQTLIELAGVAARPDFHVGLVYTALDPRDDVAAVLRPPEGDGDDVFGLQGGLSIPVRRGRLDGEAEQAEAGMVAAQERRRRVRTEIDGEIGDLAQRLVLAWRQLRLVGDLLVVQAEESLQSAEAGYIAGTLTALDLLDAEHVLFEAQTAAARATTDYLIGLAELEGAVGEPVVQPET